MANITKHGKEFENNFKSGLSTLKRKNIVLRIADSGGQNAGDFLVILEKTNILVECKSTTRDPFRLSLIKPHQIDGLKVFHKAFKNNLGVVALEFAQAKECFIIPIEGLFEHVSCTGKKTISRELCNQYGFLSAPMINGKYDFSDLDIEHLELWKK